jgi:hypothetical protein
LTQSTAPRTSYASFNSFVVTGRILNSEIVKTKTGADMLRVTMVTTPVKGDDRGLNVTFVNQNGLMALFNRGQLPSGRIITVNGHIDAVREGYINTQGVFTSLKRPEVSLGFSAQILDGGLGAMPKDKDEAPTTAGRAIRRFDEAKDAPAVDKTPVGADY